MVKLNRIELRTFTEEEYHAFFKKYVPDPIMDPNPFQYSYEQISRSYAYNHGGFRKDYVHLGIFVDRKPVGSFQLKRMNKETHCCEFGIILMNDAYKNQGIGSAAICQAMKIARDQYGMERIIGDTMSGNKRMIHIFEKLGFRLMDTIPEAFHLSDGRTEDRLIYQKNLRGNQP